MEVQSASQHVHVEGLGRVVGGILLGVVGGVHLVMVRRVIHDKDHLLTWELLLERWDEAVIEPPLEALAVHVVVVVLDAALGRPDPLRGLALVSRALHGGLRDGVPLVVVGGDEAEAGDGVEDYEALPLAGGTALHLPGPALDPRREAAVVLVDVGLVREHDDVVARLLELEGAIHLDHELADARVPLGAVHEHALLFRVLVLHAQVLDEDVAHRRAADHAL